MVDRAQGYKYQLSVTAYLASLLSKNESVQDYHIFYELQEVEPFDDIVLAVKYNDSEDFRLYLVQVKSGKVKLDVNSYLKAYNQIMESTRWQCLKCHVSKISEGDIQFWYFACQKFRPQPIPFQDSKQLEIRTRTLNDEKRIINGKVYELFSKDEEVTRKYTEFFKDFYIFLAQVDTGTIITRLKGMWALNDGSQVIEYLDKYFTKNKRESLNKTDFEHELLRIRFWDSIVKPTKIIPYKKESALAWNYLTLLYNVTIVKNELDVESCLFGCILQSFDEKITVEQWNDVVDNDGKLSNEIKQKFTSKSRKPETLKDLLVYLWTCGRIPLVLKSNGSLPQLQDFLNLKQHYIIIDSDIDRRYNEIISYNLTAIKDLGDTRAEQLLQSVLVSMQGRQPASLYTVINGNKKLMQSLTCLDILKLMEPRHVYISNNCLEAHNNMLFIVEMEQPEPTNNEDYDSHGENTSISCNFNQSTDVYEKVKRKSVFKNYRIYSLRLENNKLKLIGKFGENKLNEGFQDLESFQIDQNGNRVYAIDENHVVPIIGEVTKINCTKYLRRYIRKGTIKKKGHRSDKTVDSIIKFEETVFPGENFFEEANGKICVITGEAGIGKTTFLQALIQNCHPQYYLIFCNLAQFQVDMRENTQKLFKDPLNILWRKQRPLLYDHFLNMLQKTQKRLILLLDSFDEVIPTCKEQVLKVIKILNDEARLEKIIISSRLLTVQLLINQFTTINVTKIEKFDKKYNGHYLGNWNLDENSLQEIPIEFATNPLYLDMLRTISQNSEINFQTLRRWTLYNHIVDSKIKHYSRRYNYIIDDFEKKNILRFHWGLALKSIFGNNPVTEKFSHEGQAKFNNAMRLGMVKDYDEKEDPVFIHYTFAEFFVAQWFIETTDKNDAKFIYKMMLENERYNVLDIHSEEFPLHKAVLNADDGDVEVFEQIEKLLTKNKKVLLQTDAIGRTALHVLGSRYRHDINRCLETIIRYMSEEGYYLYSRDNLMNWTWIDYCDYFSELFITDVSPSFSAIHEAYWNYYASSPFRKCFDSFTVVRSYQIAVNDFLPSTLVNLLFVNYFDNEDFRKFHSLCLSSEVNVVQLPKYFELDRFNLKPLHLAVIYSNINVVRACIKRGDKVIVADRFGCTPLYYSILKQSSEIVKLLLEKGGCKLEMRKDSVFSTFQLSLRIGNKDITKMLIEAIDLKKLGSDWLWDAVRFGDIEVIALLLETKIDPNIGRSEYESERFVDEIHYRNALNALKKCYDYNYDVSTMPLDEFLSITDALQKMSRNYNPVSSSLLNTAIHARRKDIVHLLLQNGVHINTKVICYDYVHMSEKEFSESTPLCCAVRSWNIDMVELLLQHNANVNYVESNGLTPLITAIREDVVMHKDADFENSSRWITFNLDLYKEHRTDISQVIYRLDWSLSKPAFLHRRLQIVAVLLRYGADVNFKVEDDVAPLDEALNTRNWTIVEMLLFYGANPNDLNQWDFTDILAVLPTENIKIIELLLKNGANPNFKTAYDVTPLYVAARRRHADMVRLLLEYGASTDIITSTHTLLAKSKENGEIDFVTLLLDLDKMCFVGPIYDVNYPVEVVNLLQTVQNERDINFPNEIDIICNSSNVKFIQKLVWYAADLRNPNGMKYINVVLELRKPEIDQILLENLSNYHECGNAAVYAAKHRNKPMIEILARNGQGVNSINEAGRTALVSAIENSMDKPVIKFLLENKAEVNLVDKYGNTPLAWAIEKQNIGIIEILLKYGATVNYIEKDGFTPLIDAINNNDAEIVRILLDNGADVNFACKSGLTPINTAKKIGNTEIIKILLRYEEKSQ